MKSKLDEKAIKFGLKIKLERMKRKFSQEKLAELANISTNSISAIENAKSSPTLETIHALAKALNIKPSELIDTDKIEL